ncbi:N-acetylneuraminate synthase family protein [Haloarculaceae archaeon H-GB2-1]|nr:N-acetylneuraminate synthase family protein [Haloarculaceae archaeon H-GB2-1]
MAEIGGNHGGDVETAKRYLRAAAEAGADAAKFQYYHAANLIDEDEPPLPLAGDDYDTQYERFEELELAPEEWDELVALANEVGVDFAASAFDRTAADFTANHSPFIKVASGDLTNVPLLRYVRSLDVPVILSTGFATMPEIERAVEELTGVELALLHCVGAYPTPDEAANLQMIDRLAERFDVPVGYSDHTVGMTAPTAAVARGATIVEKHFTLDTSKEVGDHRLSATPADIERFVEQADRIWEMVGHGDRSTVFGSESRIKTQMRRSLSTREPVAEGEQFTDENLTALRPEGGISPLRYDDVLGATAARDIGERQLLEDADVSE